MKANVQLASGSVEPKWMPGSHDNFNKLYIVKIDKQILGKTNSKKLAYKWRKKLNSMPSEEQKKMIKLTKATKTGYATFTSFGRGRSQTGFGSGYL